MENNEVCSLENKSCIPCQGGVPPLSSKETDKFLKELKGTWKLNAQGHLTRDFVFDNFMKALDFANKIAPIAEKEGHHPDLTVTWGKCGVEIWTHKINGLTESDFILAAKINQL